MPGGGKGSSPAGTTTTTTTNPVTQAQLPFLQGGWESAQNLYQNSPYSYYPGTTLAAPNQYLTGGYNNLASTAGAVDDWMRPAANSTFASLTNGINNLYTSPAFSGLSDIASGSNAYLQTGAADQAYLRSLATQASTNNPYAGMLGQLQTEASRPDYGMNRLQDTASGMYLNSNPYLDSMFGSASDAVTRAYQTATAPQTASNFSGAGRYGSGAYAGMVGQNEQNLGSTLGNLSANIYGGNYQAERARQDAASQALSSLIAQNYGIQGNLLNSAGAQYLQGLNQSAGNTATAAQLGLANLGAQQNALNTMQSGYQTGNQQQLGALSLFPSLMQSQFMPANMMVQAGQGLTALDQAALSDQEKRFYGEQQAPWTNLNQYMTAIGQPTTGSGSVSQPYFTNPMANLLGGATGALGLYNGVGNAMGKGAGAAGTLAPGAGLFEGTGLINEAALMGGGGKGLSSLLPFAL